MIEERGAVSVAEFMAEANSHYYASRDPFGIAGDFITAPEISQMFGELIGAFLADLWHRAGQPGGCHYVELGPGRGTLAADALRALRTAGLACPVELVETSPVLRRMQAERVPQASWHDSIDTLPKSGPLLIVANEFFDALPIRQLVATDTGWSERLVTIDSGTFRPTNGPATLGGEVPEALRSAPPGALFETSPASREIVERIAERIADQGGLLLIIDYGHARTGLGDTLQAVRAHRYADPWANPGENDLTAHLDFETLGRAAHAAGTRVHGPVEQGRWLHSLGIVHRADMLARKAPDRAAELETACRRLTDEEQMGRLFKVMACVAQDWPIPAGFR